MRIINKRTCSNVRFYTKTARLNIGRKKSVCFLRLRGKCRWAGCWPAARLVPPNLCRRQHISCRSEHTCLYRKFYNLVISSKGLYLKFSNTTKMFYRSLKYWAIHKRLSLVDFKQFGKTLWGSIMNCVAILLFIKFHTIY